MSKNNTKKKIATTLACAVVIANTATVVSFADSRYDNVVDKSPGYISRVAEVGPNGHAGFISSGQGDYGGISYGTPQFTSEGGGASANSFVSWLKVECPELGNFFEGVGRAGTDSFSNAWREANSHDTDKFLEMQLEYKEKEYVQPFIERVKNEVGIDLASTRALYEFATSTAVQYGEGLGLSVVKGSGVTPDMDEKTMIRTLNQYKINNVDRYFTSSSQDVKNGVRSRYIDEGKEYEKIIDSNIGFDNEDSKDSIDDLINSDESSLNDLIEGEISGDKNDNTLGSLVENEESSDKEDELSVDEEVNNSGKENTENLDDLINGDSQIPADDEAEIDNDNKDVDDDSLDDLINQDENKEVEDSNDNSSKVEGEEIGDSSELENDFEDKETEDDNTLDSMVEDDANTEGLENNPSSDTTENNSDEEENPSLNNTDDSNNDSSNDKEENDMLNIESTDKQENSDVVDSDAEDTNPENVDSSDNENSTLEDLTNNSEDKNSEKETENVENESNDSNKSNGMETSADDEIDNMDTNSETPDVQESEKDAYEEVISKTQEQLSNNKLNKFFESFKGQVDNEMQKYLS